MRGRAVAKALVLMCLAALAALCLGPPGRAAPQPLDPASASKWREDLRVMARDLPIRHKNAFANIARTDFERHVKSSTPISRR